jgi:hypothetical protein
VTQGHCWIDDVIDCLINCGGYAGSWVAMAQSAGMHFRFPAAGLEAGFCEKVASHQTVSARSAIPNQE